MNSADNTADALPGEVDKPYLVVAEDALASEASQSRQRVGAAWQTPAKDLVARLLEHKVLLHDAIVHGIANLHTRISNCKQAPIQ